MQLIFGQLNHFIVALNLCSEKYKFQTFLTPILAILSFQKKFNGVKVEENVIQQTNIFPLLSDNNMSEILAHLNFKYVMQGTVIIIVCISHFHLLMVNVK